MKKYILGVAFVLLVFIVSACTTQNNIKQSTGAAAADNTNNNVFEKKTSSGQVTIDLQPHAYSNGELDFDISLNTHSVDMSQFDLTKIVELIADGSVYYPVSAPTLAGHHNSGTLKFEIPSEPSSFKVTIKGIPDVDVRTFEWT